MEHGKVEIGAEILLRIGREFGNDRLKGRQICLGEPFGFWPNAG
jgi:hypothetical protein